VRVQPWMSIQGLTFLRNKVPDPALVRDGTYISPLFGGPDGIVAGAHFPQTLDVYREWLREDMPLPNMMLGYSGERGNTKEEILDYLRRGAASDGTSPTGTVYFVTGDGIRAKCRSWQFVGARAELANLGFRAVITDSFPAGQQALGLLMGQAWVYPDGRISLLPGSMAEHLTSAAGNFVNGNQTKMSVWLKAGATASAGTVTEPYAKWPKFPHARFFVHYRAGCTMLESFYQSIRCPLQTLLLGEPLSRPWRPNDELILEGLEGETASGIVTIRAEVKTASQLYYRKYMFLLDGKVIGRRQILKMDTTLVPDGEHELRCVAYSVGLVREQVFAEKKITVRNGKSSKAGK